MNGPEKKSVASGDDGKFRVDGLAPGKYVVSAAAPERYAPFRDSPVTLADRGCSEVMWRTLLDGHIRGHVYFSDGTPAAGVYLTAKSADSQPNQPWTWRASYLTSTADGSFDFGTMAAGSYVFAVNMDFAPTDGKPYYRKAFFPGAAQRSGAALITIGPGEASGELRFFLPPDSPPATIPLEVKVLGFHGEALPGAQILAFDDMWENSVTPVSAATDAKGNAVLMLREGSRYDIEAVASPPGNSQSCAEPVAVEARGELAPLQLVLQHHFGNCLQFKARRKDVP